MPVSKNSILAVVEEASLLGLWNSSQLLVLERNLPGALEFV